MNIELPFTSFSLPPPQNTNSSYNGLGSSSGTSMSSDSSPSFKSQNNLPPLPTAPSPTAGVLMSSIPPFLKKLYEMLEDPTIDTILSWHPKADNIILIHDPLALTQNLLPKYFKHGNFCSFIRQLNSYGFRKADSDRWEFRHDVLKRSDPSTLLKISRRKSIKRHSSSESQQNIKQQEFVDQKIPIQDLVSGHSSNSPLDLESEQNYQEGENDKSYSPHRYVEEHERSKLDHADQQSLRGKTTQNSLPIYRGNSSEHLNSLEDSQIEQIDNLSSEKEREDINNDNPQQYLSLLPVSRLRQLLRSISLSPSSQPSPITEGFLSNQSSQPTGSPTSTSSPPLSSSPSPPSSPLINRSSPNTRSPRNSESISSTSPSTQKSISQNVSSSSSPSSSPQSPHSPQSKQTPASNSSPITPSQPPRSVSPLVSPPTRTIVSETQKDLPHSQSKENSQNKILPPPSFPPNWPKSQTSSSLSSCPFNVTNSSLLSVINHMLDHLDFLTLENRALRSEILNLKKSVTHLRQKENLNSNTSKSFEQSHIPIDVSKSHPDRTGLEVQKEYISRISQNPTKMNRTSNNSSSDSNNNTVRLKGTGYQMVGHDPDIVMEGFSVSHNNNHHHHLHINNNNNNSSHSNNSSHLLQNSSHHQHNSQVNHQPFVSSHHQHHGIVQQPHQVQSQQHHQVHGNTNDIHFLSQHQIPPPPPLPQQHIEHHQYQQYHQSHQFPYHLQDSQHYQHSVSEQHHSSQNYPQSLSSSQGYPQHRTKDVRDDHHFHSTHPQPHESSTHEPSYYQYGLVFPSITNAGQIQSSPYSHQSHVHSIAHHSHITPDHVSSLQQQQQQQQHLLQQANQQHQQQNTINAPHQIHSEQQQYHNPSSHQGQQNIYGLSVSVSLAHQDIN